MLHRAASNAYSWWWASHIRTKQSKWLDQNLQDMEEKVNYTLRIIDDDGDTFAQRAEMYYKKRPEIVNFVEEAFRSYRALAERYDSLSRELQNANRTIATAFPERVQFPLDDEDEENPDKQNRNLPNIPKGSIPKVPNNPKRDSMLLSRKGQLRKLTSSATKATTQPSSGLNKNQALEEIDKLQKGILALQTEKEFVRSSYERGYDKYWEIENEITEMQKRVCNLQDEFGIGIVIEDNEARRLMVDTALKSCQETLGKLEERQKQSAEEAIVEQGRVKEAHKKFSTLKSEFLSRPRDFHETGSASGEWKGSDQLVGKDGHDAELLGDKIKEELTVSSSSSLTVTQLADKIDELVDKVVSLDTAVSSQTAMVKRLRSETDGLHKHIRNLEEEKETLIEGSGNMSNKIKELEEEVKRVKSFNQSVQEHNINLRIHFTEASSSIDHLSGRLRAVKIEDDGEISGLFRPVRAALDTKSDKGVKEHCHDISVVLKDTEVEKEEKEDAPAEESNRLDFASDNPHESVQEDKAEKKDSSEPESSSYDIEADELEADEEEDHQAWRQVFANGLEDTEKILLEEYSSVLQNYRTVKKKLGEVEKKNRDGFYELALQIRELKNAVAFKDVEIQSLRGKLNSSEKSPQENPEGNESEYRYSNQEGAHESTSQLTSPPVSNFSPLSSPLEELLASAREKETSSEATSPGDMKKTPIKSMGKGVKVKSAKSSHGVSTVQERIRSDIDELLEENLEFWLRFSTSFHQIQKFQTSIQDLKLELAKLKGTRKQDGTAKQQSLPSDARPIYKHLREIQTELTLWLENNAVLKDELQGRYSSLCNIQDEISRVTSKNTTGEEIELSEYQAAKFHGEVLNMKQENYKVSKELQAGIDRVKQLKVDVEHIVEQLEKDLGLSANKPQSQTKSSSGRPRIPLRSFLFGVKLKKQRQKASIFSCVNPQLQKQYSYIALPKHTELPE